MMDKKLKRGECVALIALIFSAVGRCAVIGQDAEPPKTLRIALRGCWRQGSDELCTLMITNEGAEHQSFESQTLRDSYIVDDLGSQYKVKEVTGGANGSG